MTREKPARRLTVWALLAACVSAVSPAFGATCADFDVAVRAAELAGDSAKAESLYHEAQSLRACGGRELDMVGRNAALAFYRSAFAVERPADERVEMLRRGLLIGRPWQLAASVGDVEALASNYGSAAERYQEALDDIRNELLNPTPPPASVIAALIKKTEEARLLSPVYVKQINRAGEPTGLACPSFRGFDVKKTAMPVEFVYREADFTDKGMAAVTDMLDFLTRQGSPDIHLIGHTDPRGSVQFNQDLSERRADAVAGFLRSKDYRGKVTTSGRGKEQRFQADDPGRYNEEQLFQLDRRVELDRKSGGTECVATAD